MKNLQATAVIALMTAAIGLSAIAPTYAQDAAAPAATAAQPMQAHFNGPMGKMGQHDGQGRGDHRQGGARGMGGFIDFERGSEAVEIALVCLSHAVDMTTEQQALFATLKTDALAAAKFSAAVEGLRPAAPAAAQAAERPDFTKALDNRIAIEAAHLAALEAVQPSLTAFFGSLTDEQKAALTPQRGDHDGMRQRGQQHQDHNGSQSGPMGGQRGIAPANG